MLGLAAEDLIGSTAPDGVIGNDAGGRIATWNPGAERMFGLAAGEAVGRPYEEAAARMSEHVDASMQVARVAMGHGPDEPVPVRLALEDALNALRAAIRESGAQIRVQEPLRAAAVPRAELALVLQNLLANAIRFARADAPPDVRVSGALRGGCVELRIADNGVGLTAADRAEMFGIFGRAQQGVPGTGLGLAVCRRILERRNGSMSASSPGRDRGTEFVVSVPAATPG